MVAKDKINCPHCGASTKSDLRFCPKCGRKLNARVDKHEKGKDPYIILEISNNASKEVIAASYKALAKKFHPDKDPTGKEKMRGLNWAYDILSNSTKKSQWDREHVKEKSKPKPKPKPKPQSRTDDPKVTHTRIKRDPSPEQARTGGRKAEVRTRNVIIAFIAICVLGVLCILSGVGGSVMQSVMSSGSPSKPTQTLSRVPTNTPRRTPTSQSQTSQTSSYPGCISWRNVQDSYILTEQCVFGVVVGQILPSSESENYHIFFGNDFSSSSHDFRIVSFDRWYFNNVEIGDCIAVRGTIRDYGTFLFIDPFSQKYPGSLWHPLPTFKC